jgi:hypothetical protein
MSTTTLINAVVPFVGKVPALGKNKDVFISLPRI